MSVSATGAKNYGGLDANGNSYPIQRPAASGPSVDFDITSPDDYREPGSESYMTSRRARSAVSASEVVAAASPSTDIYQRLMCAGGCGQIVDEVGLRCQACAPKLGPRMCTAPLVTDGAIGECKGICHEGLDVCRRHAEERAMIPAADLAGSCQWRNCATAKAGGLPFCAAHALEAGLLVLAPQTGPAAKTRTPKAKTAVTATPDAPKARRGRPRAPHADGCMCAAHKKATMRAANLIESGAAEANG